MITYRRRWKREVYNSPSSLDDKAELSVLIGSDYYWQVVTGQVERLTESLVALESIFRRAVQGPVAVSSLTETNMYANSA